VFSLSAAFQELEVVLVARARGGFEYGYFFFPVSVLSKVRGGARARGGFEYGLVFVFKV